MKVDEILAKLVSYDTVGDKNKDAIFAFVREFLARFDFDFREVGGSLVAERGGNFAKIGFSGHIDVVPVGNAWTTNPFVLTEDGDKLIGRGACDMKGGIAAFMWAAANTTSPMKIYLTYGEEITCQGMYDLLNSREKWPKVVVFAESTDGKVWDSGKGIFSFRADFVGERNHASRAVDDGKQSAIFAAMDFAAEIRSFAKNIQARSRDDRYELPVSTVNIGKFEGGDSQNSTAESAWIGVDIRTISADDQREFREKVSELAQKYGAKIEILDDWEIFENTTMNAKIREIFDNKFVPADVMTEATLLPNDITRIVLGPGPRNEHQTNEYVSRKSLENVAETYVKIIEEMEEK
jgi:acetylornithine deacetylase